MSQDAATRKRAQREAWRRKVERAEVAPSPPQDRSWRLEAACRNLDLTTFTTDDDRTIAGAARVREAQRVCATCAVRTECGDYALSVEGVGVVGVWGGMSEAERRRARRARVAEARTLGA